MKLDQNRTPYLDALKEYCTSNVLPLDVPGHHMGNVANKLKDYVGPGIFKNDVNAPIGMDNLAHPHGVLKEAMDLMSDFTGADHSFFLINGTSSGILAMIMSTCKANDKIILPRNVHKSIINGLVLSGACPIYIMPRIDTELEIANQPTIDEYIQAMQKYPSAKAIFVINPTYFGAVNDLKRLVEEAHSRGIAVLVDEAHGAHYYFDDNGPVSAMKAGADAASVSFHKTGGSLTQTSVLLLKSKIIDACEVQKILNTINTTSPNAVFLASIDAARCYAATEGRKNMENVHEIAKYAKEKISQIKGFKYCDRTHFIKHGCYDHDETKIVLEITSLDINGFEIYQLLKREYNIQIELAESFVILGILAIGSNFKQINRFINALKDISKKHYVKNSSIRQHNFTVDFPYQIARPRVAFHALGKKVKLEDAVNCISKEQIMVYPPGIPLIVPGEIFTKDLVERIVEYRKQPNITILSDYGVEYVNVIDTENWTRYKRYQNKLNEYVTKHISNPRADNFIYPFEGDKHQGTIIQLPYRKDTWRKNAVPALKTYKEIIYTISQYEPVYVCISPRIYNRVIKDYENKKNIVPIKIKYNDAWARDIAPLFVTDGEKLRTVDFRFNAWGGEVDGLYQNYKDDDAFGKNISKFLKLDRYHLDNFVLEGGSISIDGEKTCLVTKACLLSEGRNPDLDKNEIEETLKTYLNVSKIIWLDNGIYNDETNEHVDNMACFVKPGVVALAWTDNKEDPQYKFCQSAYKTLKNSTDACGRQFEIVKIKLPEPQYMSKSESKGIVSGKNNAIARLEGNRLAASYINYYQSDKFVIIPAFNVPEDKLALKKFKELYPNKDVIQIDTREILLGGGNIHCITMQIPDCKEKIKYED